MPRTVFASTKSSYDVMKLNAPGSKQQSFAQDYVTNSVGFKGTHDSEVSCSTIDRKWEQNRGTIDTSWKRSFASVVSNSTKLTETDSTENSNSHVGVPVSDVQSVRSLFEVDTPDWVGVNNFKSDEELTGHDKLRGEQQLYDDRISYSSAVRNTNKYPKTDICNIEAAASKSSQLDQQNMERDLIWERCHWDCENYCSYGIGRDYYYTQRKIMLDKSGGRVPCNGGWDDSSNETKCSMPAIANDRERGHEPVPPTKYLRTSQTTSEEFMNSLPSIQEDISDQSTEWDSLCDAIQLNIRQNVPSPEAEIMKVITSYNVFLLLGLNKIL